MARTAPIVALLATQALLTSSAWAQDRELLLSFIPGDGSSVLGYMAYLRDLGSQAETSLDLGFVPTHSDGLAQASVMVDSTRAYALAVSAYNEAGTSPRSNEVQVDPLTPACEPASCDDGNPCTTDGCDAMGCFNSAVTDGTLCDDGYIDTVDDQCIDATCEGVLLVCRDDLDCDDGNVCNGRETCDGGTVCLQGSALECGQSGPCSVSTCDASLGCRTDSLPDGSSCDDGLADTTGDTCWAGVCEGTPLGPEPSLAAIGPDTLGPGTHTVVIYGAGFVPGATLNFRNGPGKTPRVQSLLLVSEGELEAQVEVFGDGPRRVRSFDVVVDLPNGWELTLPGAFQVDPQLR